MEGVKVPNTRMGWPIAVAVAVNLIPIVGVILWGWSAFALIVLYWLENIVIGVRNLLSMLATALLGGGLNWIGALFFGAFFTVHYGMFCYGHGIFVMAMFGAAENGAFHGDTMLDLAGAVRALFTAQSNLAIGFASIVLWQFVQFVLFLVRGEVRRTNPLELMGAPYPRIVVLHVTIIFGGFILLGLNQPTGGVIMLALVKMAYDVAEIMGKAPNFKIGRVRSNQAAGGGDDAQRLVP